MPGRQGPSRLAMVVLLVGGCLPADQGRCTSKAVQSPPGRVAPISSTDHGASSSIRAFPGEGAALAFFPDGETLAIASGVIRLWDLVHGKKLCEVETGFDVGATCKYLAFSPDG